VVHRIGGPEIAKPGPGLPDKETCQRILNAISQAWHAGAPWSVYPQTQKEGRFAPATMVRTFGVKKVSVAENLLQEWQRNGVVRMEICNQHTKMKGLKVL
jgi:hypothetical protein